MEAPSSADRRGTAGAGQRHTTSRGGDPRRFSTTHHQVSWGIDWHARTLDLCVLHQAGEVLLPRERPAAPGPFLQAMAPSREDVVVGVEGLFTWYGLADRCAQEGIPFVLGPALSMQASHGGQATNAKLDAPEIAVLLRGGRRPQASVDPAAMRATRDLLRRRMHLMRQRAELLAHVQKTNSHYHLPELGKQLASKGNRAGVAERFPEPAIPPSMAVDLTLIDTYDRLLTDLELDLVRTAKAHEAQTFYRLRSLPGIGKIWALVLLDAIHDLRRFPRVQDFGSYCRLVTWAKESAGNRSGPSGPKSGKASLTWACSEAAVLVLRHNPAGQKYLARVARNHGKGKALTLLAQQLARAVYYMLKRDTACDWDKFLCE